MESITSTLMALNSTTAPPGGIPHDEIWMVATGFVIAFILAFGIGANDVANSFGTSVGAKVLTLLQACILGTIFETAGALLMGAKVSETIRRGILDVTLFQGNHQLYMVGQVASLTGACVWLLLATFFRLPVSGTHSIVGAILGFSLVAHGANGINWVKIALIAASWFISPLLAGGVSVGIFYVVRRFILEKNNCLEAGLLALPFIYAFTIIINTFSIFYEGPEMLGFHKIPLYGTVILSVGCGLITGLAVRFAVVPWQRTKIEEAVKDQEKKEIEHQKETVDEVVETRSRAGSLFTVTQKVCEPSFRRPSVASSQYSASLRSGSIGGSHFTTAQERRRGRASSASNPGDPHFWAAGHPRSSAGRQRSASETQHIDYPHPQLPFVNEAAEFGSSGDELGNGPESNGAPQGQAGQYSTSDLPGQRTKASAVVGDGNIQTRYRETSFSYDSPAFEQDAIDDLEEEEEQIFSKGIQVDIIDLEDKTIKMKSGRQEIVDKPEASMLFSFLQILTAIFGSFAHGGNDVSNAIGPLIGLWMVSQAQDVDPKMAVPIWVLFYGSVGISIGLWVWGRRVIKTLGEDLTKITPTSGFCIEIGTALTVLVASNIGIPISTTHCKVGAVVCTGRFRSRENVDWRVFRNIIFAWIVTLPMSGGIAAGAFAALRLIIE